MKKTDYKKTLVRNTVQPTQTITKNTNEKVKFRITNDQLAEKANVDNCRLDKPELQSTLKLSKAIDKISKHNRTKSLTDSEKLAVDEKVTRRVNFPYDKYIYKDLIPLEVDQCKLPLTTSSRGPLPQKDKEPVLADFLDTKTLPKYYSLPHIKVENKINTITNNPLRLYQFSEKTTYKQPCDWLSHTFKILIRLGVSSSRYGNDVLFKEGKKDK